MESESLGAHYRKQTYYVVAGAGLLILVGFSIVEYIGNNLATMWTDAATALIVAVSLLATSVRQRRPNRPIALAVGDRGPACCAWS